ncbi:hypothetical protein HDU97_001342 [Phlyctochytrium planicorne]|nr:hypothetical protein HDU97_001342 [Phlyctochytrium planicorne]
MKASSIILTVAALVSAASAQFVDQLDALANVAGKPYTLSILSKAISGSNDLTLGLKYVGNNILFAPIDAAFKDVDVKAFIADPINIVSYHIVPNVIDPKNGQQQVALDTITIPPVGFVPGGTSDINIVHQTGLNLYNRDTNLLLAASTIPQTIGDVVVSGRGQHIKITVEAATGKVFVQSGLEKAQVIDTLKTNVGPVYVVDKIIAPPPKAVEALRAINAPFVKILTTAFPDTLVNGLAGITVFVPKTTDLSKATAGQLALHIVNGYFNSTDIVKAITANKGPLTLTTYHEESITVSTDASGAVFVQGAGNAAPVKVISTDSITIPGWIHVIDDVLIPSKARVSATLTQIDPQLLPGQTKPAFTPYASPKVPDVLPGPNSCPKGLIFSAFPVPTTTTTTTTIPTTTSSVATTKSTSTAGSSSSSDCGSNTSTKTTSSIPAYTPVPTSKSATPTAPVYTKAPEPPVYSSSTKAPEPAYTVQPVPSKPAAGGSSSAGYVPTPDSPKSGKEPKPTSKENIYQSSASRSVMSSLLVVPFLVALRSPLVAFVVAIMASVSAVQANVFLGVCTLDEAPTVKCKTKPFVADTFEVVPNFFFPSTPDLKEIPANYGNLLPSLGHVNRTDPLRWVTFQQKFEQLQCSDPNSMYKLFHVMRHGRANHNDAESSYGTPAWNAFYSKIPLYYDTALTVQGIQQTFEARQVMMNEYAIGAPMPGLIVSSPLQRTLNTTLNVWQWWLEDGPKLTPLAIEDLREGVSGHTCDSRRSVTDLKKLYPQFDYTKMWSENDEYWKPDFIETGDQQTARNKKALIDLFLNYGDVDTIHFTGHGGSTGKFLINVQHPTGWNLKPGGVISMVVRAYKKQA